MDFFGAALGISTCITTLTHEAFIDVQKESKSVRLMPPFSNGFINVLRLILSGLLSQIKLNISHLIVFEMSSGNFGKTDRRRVSLGIANVLITVDLPSRGTEKCCLYVCLFVYFCKAFPCGYTCNKI